MNSTVKTVVFWLVIVLSAFLLWQVMKAGSAGQKDKEVNFSQFLTDVDQGNVKEVTITGQEVRGKYRNDDSAFPHHRPVELSRHDQDAARQGRQHEYPRHHQRQLASAVAGNVGPADPAGGACGSS